jgi:hypothetical protein
VKFTAVSHSPSYSNLTDPKANTQFCTAKIIREIRMNSSRKNGCKILNALILMKEHSLLWRFLNMFYIDAESLVRSKILKRTGCTPCVFDFYLYILNVF